MAVTALSPATFPILYYKTGVGTTLAEFTLPAGSRQVWVETDAAGWVQFTGADGDAVSATAKNPTAANVRKSFALGTSGNTATKVLVAAQAATCAVSISVEGVL